MWNRSAISKSASHTRSGALAALIAATALATCGAGSARADASVSGSSNAYNIASTLMLSLNAAGVPIAGVDASLAPSNMSAGSSPPLPYSVTSNTANVNLTSGVVLAMPVLSVGNGLTGANATAFVSTASSNINSTSTSGTVSASSTTSNLDLGVLKMLTLPIVDVTASAVTTSAQVSGTFGNLATSGTPSIANLAIKILGVPFNIGNLSPGVFVATNLAGLTIGYDISTLTGDHSTTEAITTQALDLRFANAATGVLGGVTSGVLNGDIILGSSTALMNAASIVPEPASALMTACGIGLIGLVARRLDRRRRPAAPARA